MDTNCERRFDAPGDSRVSDLKRESHCKHASSVAISTECAKLRSVTPDKTADLKKGSVKAEAACAAVECRRSGGDYMSQIHLPF